MGDPVNLLLVPTYEYACTECGHTFEQFQSFSDDALGHCPVCNGRLRKVFNAVGVVFKGSGFYRTDSRAQATGDATSGGASKVATKDSSSSSTADSSTGSSGASTSSSKESSSGAKPAKSSGSPSSKSSD
jgi:putative FmdB family regulatory protein